MLPKQHRLTLRTEFSRLRSQGKMVAGQYFSLLYLISEDATPSRFAFIVSKKIDKRATARNRVRRLLSEAVRSELPKLKPGVEGVFLTKKSIVDQNLDEIKSDVENIFQNARLFK